MPKSLVIWVSPEGMHQKTNCVKAAKLNTRYKNPQLVAQHCFVASFGQCFALFTLNDQLDPQQKHLLRVEEMQRSDWLICNFDGHLTSVSNI